MTLHYSLYSFPDSDSGAENTIDLSKVKSVVKYPSAPWYCVAVEGIDDDITLKTDQVDPFIAAWNRYKYATAAAAIINPSSYTNATIGGLNALEIDEMLGFLAAEKVKELQALEVKNG